MSSQKNSMNFSQYRYHPHVDHGKDTPRRQSCLQQSGNYRDNQRQVEARDASPMIL